METEPLVSVAIPVYNSEPYLRECVDKVLGQTYTHTEIILVDDGSADRSGQLCDEYAAADSRIVVVHKKNGGASSARNVGCASAGGEYIYFTDSDDYIRPDAIEKLTAAIQENNADFIFFDGTVIFSGYDDHGDPDRYIRKKNYPLSTGKTQLDRLLRNDEYRVLVQLLFIRTEYLKKAALSFVEGIVFEDQIYVLLLYLNDGLALHMPETFLTRRIHADSVMTSENKPLKYRSMLTVYNEFVKLYGTDEVSDEFERIMVRTARAVIRRYKNLDDKDKQLYKESFSCFRKSMKSNHFFVNRKLFLLAAEKVRKRVIGDGR